MIKLTIGFSPCPNDTFIFDALVNDKINKGELQLEVILEDVETLNMLALQGRLDITKLSYGVWPAVMDKYQLLDAGSALGKGVGPLLISKHPIAREKINDCTVLIPGQHTTAHLLFSHAFPAASKKLFVRYDQIENELLNSENELLAGVIIHENRFTYEEKGLLLVNDLGKYWEEETGIPIPLGGIVTRKEFPQEWLEELNQLIRRSIEYSWSYFPALSDYVKANAIEMSEEVMRKHIQLYVNDFSIDLGNIGKAAVEKFVGIYNYMHSV